LRGEEKMIIGFVIWSITALIFLAIGISSCKQKESVGFFTFVNPPIVKDVEKYNRAVSKLWIIAAVLFEFIGTPLLFFEQNSPVFIIVIFATMAWVIAIMVVYIKIEIKCSKKAYRN